MLKNPASKPCFFYFDKKPEKRFFQTFVFLSLFVSLLASRPLYAQEAETPIPPRTIDVEAARRAILEEDPAELTSMKLGDTSISLELSGFWNPAITLTWGLTNTKLGLGVASVGSPFLFEQSVDLTLALWIRERWFIEASFSDDSPLNTYSAGYKGGENEPVEFTVIGNTGLDFPKFPYMDLGGGVKSSFGYYGRFNTGPLKLHTLLRYDAAESEESIFIGGRERAYNYINFDAIQHGVSFVLPKGIMDIPVVYLEDENGWRVAAPSEAAVSAALGIVELQSQPKRRVAVYYAGIDIQAFLNEAEIIFGIRLDEPDYRVNIDGRRALLIYAAGLFSPFEVQNRYKAFSPDSEEADVVHTANGSLASGFTLTRDETAATAAATAATDSVFYRLSAAASIDERWPLLQSDNPTAYIPLYLGSKTGWPNDLRIRFTNFAQSPGFNIGSDVLPGSIAVYRGGLPDDGFSFNSGTGEVVLRTPTFPGEVIRITYLRTNNNRRSGSAVAGLGIVYKNDDSPFSAALGGGVRWNIENLLDKNAGFSEYGQSNAGRAGLGGEVLWEGAELNAALRLGAGYEESDATGLYRAAGMEGHEITFVLREESAFQSYPPQETTGIFNGLNNRAGLVYRKYRDTNAAGVSSLLDITNNRPIENSIDGPYAAYDGALKSAVIAAEAELNGNYNWAGYEIPIGNIKSVLSSSRIVKIPFHLYEFDNYELVNTEIYVQFGQLRANNSSAEEIPNLTVTKRIYNYSVRLDSNNCAIAEIYLNYDERIKLEGASHFRLIIISKDNAVINGRVLLSPLIIQGAVFQPVVIDGAGNFIVNSFNKVTAVEDADSELQSAFPGEIKRLHPEGGAQRVLKINWNRLSAYEYAGADSLIPYVPFEKYKTLSFYVKKPENGGNLALYAAESRETIEDYYLKAIFTFPIEIKNNEWAKVTINYLTGKDEIYVNGIKVNGTVSYRAAKNAITPNTTYMLFYLEHGGGDFLNGGFSIDEICLEESIPDFWGNAGTTLRWQKDGTVLKTGGVTLLENVLFENTAEGGIHSALDINGRNDSSVVTRSRAQFTLFKTNIGGNLNYSFSNGNSSEKRIKWESGHFINRNILFFTIRENFSLVPDDTSWTHSAAVNTRFVFSPSFESSARENLTSRRRSWSGSLNFSPKQIPFYARVNGGASFSEASEKDAAAYNYADTYMASWKALIPDMGQNAYERIVNGAFNASLQTNPVGASFSFTPSVNAKTPSNTNAVSAVSTSGSTNMTLAFPWKIKSFSGSLEFARNWGSSKSETAFNIKGDVSNYYESFYMGKNYLFALPFNSLFDAGLADMPLYKNVVTESFSDNNRFVFNLPRSAGISQFFIPRSFETSLSRKINRRYDTISDSLRADILSRFNAANLFGAAGQHSLFKFYRDDEFNNMISLAIEFPKQEDVKWNLIIDQDFWFFGFRNSSLTFSDTLSFSQSGNTYSFMMYWTKYQDKNLIGKLFRYVTGIFSENNFSPLLASFAKANFEYLRSESVTFTYNGAGNSPRGNFTLGHESVVRIAGRMSFSVFLNLDISDDRASGVTTFLGKAGTKMKLNF